MYNMYNRKRSRNPSGSVVSRRIPGSANYFAASRYKRHLPAGSQSKANIFKASSGLKTAKCKAGALTN